MPFYFNSFSVEDNQSSMKVGTDAVLLALLLEIAAPQTILEVGVGCGVVSLLLAQRFPHAKIHGLDIDSLSVSEAIKNYQLSPYSERLTAECLSLQDYIRQPFTGFDLVISNPPFFTQSLKPPRQQRCHARHSDDTLPFITLLQSADSLLSSNGSLSVILPATESQKWIDLLPQTSLSLADVCTIYSKPGKPIRKLITANKLAVETCHRTFYIRDEHNEYSVEFVARIKPYLRQSD